MNANQVQFPPIPPTIQPLVNELQDGGNNGRHAAELEDRLNMPIGHTQEPTRGLVREAIVNAHIPIGSTPSRGYWLIDSDDELNEAIAQWEARAAGIQERIDALREGWRLRLQSRANGGNWPK